MLVPAQFAIISSRRRWYLTTPMEEKVYHSNFNVESTYWWFTARAHIIHTLINSVCALPKGSTVVDVGCGTGGFLSELATDYTAIGTDTSALAVEYCKKRGLEHLHLGTLDDFSQNFPADAWTVDAVTMLDVIEHIQDDQAVVKQVYDLLRPGGFFIATVPANPWMWSAHDIIHMHYRRYTKAQFGALLSGAGFKQKKLSYFNTLLFPLAALKRLTQKNLRPEDIHAVVDPVPAAVNSLFHSVFASEAALLKNASLPFGVSLVGIFQKPL